MRRRKIDGCPIAGALQMIGDKWTLLVARDLAGGPKRTMELHAGLFPISSRTSLAACATWKRTASLSAQTLAEILRTSNMPSPNAVDCCCRWLMP